MAKITWLGEDDLHGPDQGGPSWTTWHGRRFDKGKAVDITDADILAKAKGNIYFKVEGGPGRPFGSTTAARKVEADDDEDTK